MNHHSIMLIFNQFAGKEVQVIETTDNLSIGGRQYPLTSASLAENEPTIQAMKDAAAANGVKLRIWFADSMGSMDYDRNRLNVHIVKGRDNKYRVSRMFNIG